MSKVLIGVTGNIASGKSLVARMLQEKGCALVDADVVAHDLYGTDRALVKQIVDEFGPEVASTSGVINRQRLGSLVFGKPEAMAALNRIVHPVLITTIRERVLSSFRVLSWVVLDAALLIELGVAEEMDYLIFVSGSEESRLERLMERSHLSRDEAMARINSQMPEEGKRQYADFIIGNDKSQEYLQEQVDAVWEEILERESQEGDKWGRHQKRHLH